MFSDIYRNKKVLVTGDTGFKGSWLCIWLHHLGADVYGYALPPKNARDNYVTCGVNKIIHHRDGDVRDHQKFCGYFKKVKPDIAFHLAAQPLVRESYKIPRETFETNVMGTVNFFEAVRLTKSVKAAVNITTDKCYRNNEDIKGYKEEDALGGQDPYSASKSCSEMVTFAYEKSYFTHSSCSIASARAGNVIGGGDWADDRIIPDFFRAVSTGKALLVRNPDSVRPWQHVLEPLAGYLHLAAGLYQKKRNFSGSWNFGPLVNGHITVRELVEHMLETLGTGEYKIDMRPKPQEAGILTLDISKAISYLDWKPALTLKETVAYTVEGYQVEFQSGKVYQNRVDQIIKYMDKIK
jgi:CDP-glucose 4,6-dehydratase